MIRFPFVDLIEKLIKWAKETGSPVYWVWVLTIGIILGFFLIIWEKQGFNEARILLFVGLFIWLGGLYPVSQYEKYWESKKEGGK